MSERTLCDTHGALFSHNNMSFPPAVNCVCLAQLLAACGCVAFWQVSHLERSVSAELRRRRGETEEREEKEKGPAGKAKVMTMCCMDVIESIISIQHTYIQFYYTVYNIDNIIKSI